MNAKSLAVLEFDKVRRRLADHTVFSGGRRLALDLAPSTDAPEVRRRLGLTAEAREYADRRGNPGLEGAHDLRDEIEGALRGKILLPRELLEIRDTLGAARRMGKAIGRERARWPGLGALAERLEPCSALYDAIHAVFDEAGEVVDRASPNLRRIRTEMRTAHERMRRQIDGIMGSAREYLQEPLVTQRNGRYVIPVKSDFRGRVPGVVHDVSDSGATLFVEPLGGVEAGNHLRQLEIEEEREVDRILRELAGDVAAEADALRKIPFAAANRLRLMPLLIRDGRLVAALDDPARRRAAVEEAEFIAQMKVVPVLAQCRKLEDVLHAAYEKIGGLQAGRFPEPEALLTEAPLVLGPDNRKMSKSYGNAITFAMSDEEIDRAVMSMITDPQRVRRSDPGRPEVCNVYSWHRLLGAPEDELQEIYAGCTSAALGCVDDKRALAARVRDVIRPIRERRERLMADPDRLERILAEGAERARAIAAPVMAEATHAMGL